MLVMITNVKTIINGFGKMFVINPVIHIIFWASKI